MATNDLNIPLFDDNDAFFFEGSYLDSKINALIVGSCNKNGNAIEVGLTRKDEFGPWEIYDASIKRRVGKNSVDFTDMGSAQYEKLSRQLKKIGII